MVGGREVKAYSIPWQVGLVNRKGEAPSCGGMIIKDDVILTAAHCIDVEHLQNICMRNRRRCPATPMYVVSKAHSFNSKDIRDENYHKICHVEKHPKWNYNTFDFDFALLYLKDPIQCGDGRANKVCLPRRDMQSEYVGGRRRYKLRVSGWGLKEDNRVATGLRAAKQLGITNKECNHVFRRKDIQIHHNMLCAKNKYGKDACQGDSGGNFHRAEIFIMKYNYYTHLYI